MAKLGEEYKTEVNFSALYIDVTKKGKKIPKEEYLEDGEFPIIDQSQQFIAGKWNSSEGLFIETPAIVFGDHTRAIKYLDTPFFIGADGVKILRPVNENDNVKYLYYALKAARIPDLGYSRHFKVVKELNFKVYSRCAQDEIVYILESLDKLIELKERQLSLMDELVKSRFVEMFGEVNHNEIFSYKKVHEFTDVVSGGTPNRSETMYWEGGTIPWVKTTELKNKFVNKTDEYITQEGLDNSAAKIVPPDTILIAMYGQGKTRGMTAYLQVEAATNQACACILPNNEVNTIYLWHYFIMSYEHLRNLAKGGNQPNLNVKMIKNYQVAVPPIELQNQFATFVAQVDKSKFMGCNRYRIIKQPL